MFAISGSENSEIKNQDAAAIIMINNAPNPIKNFFSLDIFRGVLFLVLMFIFCVISHKNR